MNRRELFKVAAVATTAPAFLHALPDTHIQPEVKRPHSTQFINMDCCCVCGMSGIEMVEYQRWECPGVWIKGPKP